MSRFVERSVSQAVKSGAPRRVVALPAFVPPQLSQLVEKPPSGAKWVHEIKLDGYRMAARIDNGRVQLLTRTGLDWTDKYPSAIAALATLNVKTAYIDGELCGICEITYLTWTADNLLRHTVYVGLREDKPASEVRREH
jgi:ATP-dependent DNA ligase